MSVTMNAMELILADLLSPDQLMEGDIIKSPDQDIVIVKTITSTDIGFYVEAINDFDELVEFHITDDEMISWYVYPVESD
jgi:hypothetical protein